MGRSGNDGPLQGGPNFQGGSRQAPALTVRRIIMTSLIIRPVHYVLELLEMSGDCCRCLRPIRDIGQNNTIGRLHCDK